MYEKKMPFDIECGIKIAMEVIGGKWKSCIIQELNKGAKRPSELHRLSMMPALVSLINNLKNWKYMV